MYSLHDQSLHSCLLYGSIFHHYLHDNTLKTLPLCFSEIMPCVVFSFPIPFPSFPIRIDGCMGRWMDRQIELKTHWQLALGAKLRRRQRKLGQGKGFGRKIPGAQEESWWGSIASSQSPARGSHLEAKQGHLKELSIYGVALEGRN